MISAEHNDRMPAGECYVYLVRDQKILVDLKDGGPRIPRKDSVTAIELCDSDSYRIGMHDDRDCRAYLVSATVEAPQGMNFIGLRRLFGILGPEDYRMAVRAMGILNWDRTCRFCSACGSKLKRHADISAKECEACGFTMFPKISPAVIVAVEKAGTILLARASRFCRKPVQRSRRVCRARGIA